MDRIFRPSQGARDREEDGRVLYLPPPPRSKAGSVSPGGRSQRSRSRGPGAPGGRPPRRFKRLIVAADGEFVCYLCNLEIAWGGSPIYHSRDDDESKIHWS